MKKSLLLITLSFLTFGNDAVAEPPASFSEFRKGMLDDYNKFRKSVLDDYDRFLEAAWRDYEQFKGEDRYSTPKPKTAPVKPVDITPVDQPVPAPEKPAKPKPWRKPPAPTPPSQPTQPSPTSPTSPTRPPEAKAPTSLPPAKSPGFSFPYYSIELNVTDSPLTLDRQLKSTKDYARQWREFADADAKSVIPALKELAEEHSFNDYLTFEMVRAYVNSRYSKADPTARVALQHYLLANMGYDVRIAVGDNTIPLLLVPFRQHVYARPFLKLDNHKYYVFQPEGMTLDPACRIATCQLPSDADLGAPVDLHLSGLNIPVKMEPFALSYNGIELKGEVNENIFPFLYRYPQMDMTDFAESTVNADLRADLVAQLKSQLEGLPRREAVDKLLQFTQSAFEYATDGDFHGFEKPYFLEEILYYPKCDCEDRSIFYTYMLWNVLGVENHLIAYPGHESAAVRLDEDIKGTSYDYDGARFYISDPTFIGSRSGMCMPSFVKTQPKIDHIYK